MRDNIGTLGAADLIADIDATERQVDKVEHAPTGGCLVLVSISGRSSQGSKPATAKTEKCNIYGEIPHICTLLDRRFN